MMHYPDYNVKHCETMKDLLMMAERDYKDITVFETLTSTITYEAFIRNVRCAAGKMSRCKGKYVLLDIAQTDQFAAAYFAVILTGNIAVIHNSGLDKLEAPFAELPYEFVLRTKDLQMGCRQDNVLPAKEQQAENCQENPLAWEMLPDVDPDAVCTILCSSGTTASPKGICLSQRNLCSCAEAGIQKLSYPTGCRYVSVLPMYHAFGLVADLLGAVYTGGTLCIPASAIHFFASLKYYKPDAVHIPPAAADKLAEMLNKKNDYEEVTGGNLKKILCAGAPLNIKTIRTLRSFGILALSAYGQTECSPCISMNRDLDYRDGSAGLVLNSLEVCIAKDGEILVKGNGVMKGYLNEPELTGQTIRDGWLHTGDIGYLDEDGFLYVTGRKKNLAIFSDGTKYVPEALEGCLNENEDISETLVEQSGDGWLVTVCLADTKDPDRENAVSAWIHRMAVQKTNHRAERIRFVLEPLPRNGAGKLIRKI